MSRVVGSTLRLLARVVCWAVIGAAVFLGVILCVLLVKPEHPDDRLGAVILLLAVAGVIAAGVWGLRRLRRSSREAAERPSIGLTPTTDLAGEPPSEKLAGLERRVLAGETVELQPSRRRTVALLLVSILLFAASLAGLIAAPNVIWVFGVVLFGPTTLLWVARLTPGRVYLRISPEGFLVRGVLRSARWRWNQIAAFEAYEIPQPYGNTTKMVGFERRDVDHRRQGLWKTMGRGMTGVDETLPDTFGLRHAELAELLQTAHDRFATVHGPSPADLELLEEAARVRQDRLPLVTGALAIGCIAVFVLEVARYGLFPDGNQLYEAGAASRAALGAGRWWTLLAANVLHAGPIHLVLNLFGLVLLGWLLEREIGWLKLALVTLVGGLAATGAAILIQPHTEVVGVSGVIFALLGWAVVRDRLRTRALGAAAWGSLVPALVYTFLVPHVSIGGHVGGLAAGLALGKAFERAARAASPGVGVAPAPGRSASARHAGAYGSRTASLEVGRRSSGRPAG